MTEPLPLLLHQATEIETRWGMKAWCLFWEQGTMKTRTIIEIAAKKYRAGIINTLVVITDNGAHDNWDADEIPLWMPADIKWKSVAYHSNKIKTKTHKAKLRAVYDFDGLRILCMSYDAATTKDGETTLRGFLRSGKAYFVADEGSSIKTGSTDRSRVLIKEGVNAESKWLLNGTPVDRSPFDVFAQVRFVDPNFWERELGLTTFSAFKQYFANFKKTSMTWRMDPQKAKILADPEVDEGIKNAVEQEMRGQGLIYDTIDTYKNLDVLQNLLKKLSSRVLKEDVLDLPPKVYKWEYFEMTKEQERMYSSMQEEYTAGLGNEIQCNHCEGTGDDPYTDDACIVCKGGGTIYESSVTAILPMVRNLRYQQMLSGYVPTDDGEPHVDLKGENPRLKTLERILKTYRGPFIVFSRFTRDVDKIWELCQDLKLKVAKYDGRTSPDERLAIRRQFQGGELDVFDGNTAACAKAITLNLAQTMAYYTNSFRALHRWQSEDRAHRGIMKHSLTIADICCPNTVDKDIIVNLRGKANIAREVTGDRARQWLAAEDGENVLAE